MRKDQKAAMQFIWNMVTGNKEAMLKSEFVPQKAACRAASAESAAIEATSVEAENRMNRATPESQGVSSEKIRILLQRFDHSSEVKMHHFMMVKGGTVISECHFAPYRKGIWHVTYSMCKSITAMAVGILIEEGKLNLEDSISGLLEEYETLLGTIRHKDLKLKHLLTMTSGVAFNEAGIVSEEDWVKEYMNASVVGQPGEKFAYNSMNSYILSAIVTKITGETLSEYLRPRLWEPLGIRNVWWETSRKGITKGGWGLYLCAEDMAKLGQLYLQKGKWNGIQLIPEWWVEESAAKHVPVPSEDGAAGYGYHIWQGSYPGSYLFNGMFGQNVIVYPDKELVIVTNAGNSELFQDSSMIKMINQFVSDGIEPECEGENETEYQKLRWTEERLQRGSLSLPVIVNGGWKKRGRTRSYRMAEQDIYQFFRARKYKMAENNVSILPMSLQAFHNNYAEGIKRMELQVKHRKLYLTVEEGADRNEVRIGLNGAEQSELTVHQENYLISASGEVRRDEDDILVLKVCITFLEEAVERSLKLFFQDEAIKVCWDESPGKSMVMEGVKNILLDSKKKILPFNIEDYSLEVFDLAADKILRPVIEGKLEQ